jgi:hypothetical protein
MITPSFGLTATERVLPKLALDFTTASLDSRVTFTRALNTATRVNSNGLIEIVNADTPRFDFNPLTLACNGLLIEQARTNSFQYSEDFSNAWWLKTGMLAFGSGSVADAIDSPDGTQNADLLTEDTSTGNHQVASNLTTNFVSGTSYCQSYFVKANGRTKGRLTFRSNWFTASNADFDLVAKTATVVAGSTASTICGIQEFKDGWFRIFLAATATATGTSAADTYLFFADATGALSYTGDGESGMYVWGADLETGLFPTSYIPNLAASTTTRNADVATMTGTNFSDWFNASEGAFVAEGQPVVNSGCLFSVHDAGGTNYMSHIFRFGNSSRTWVFTGGGEQVNTSAPASGKVKHCFGYKVNNYAQAVNGGGIVSDTTASVPVVDRLSVGSRVGNNVLNGHIETLSYYPMRLTDAEIRAFSKQGS